mmetsp:Transcript_119442/g.244299  ORF Transcript_119442/g.244299 Transcript_119442/m.244299 type:complete len:110 (+) Transcript_119442:984-1313(+)
MDLPLSMHADEPFGWDVTLDEVKEFAAEEGSNPNGTTRSQESKDMLSSDVSTTSVRSEASEIMSLMSSGTSLMSMSSNMKDACSCGFFFLLPLSNTGSPMSSAEICLML